MFVKAYPVSLFTRFELRLLTWGASRVQFKTWANGQRMMEVFV